MTRSYQLYILIYTLLGGQPDDLYEAKHVKPKYPKLKSRKPILKNQNPRIQNSKIANSILGISKIVRRISVTAILVVIFLVMVENEPMTVIVVR